MRKLILILVALLLITVVTGNAFSGGGKVRGDNGQGAVNQVQVKDPPPFN